MSAPAPAEGVVSVVIPTQPFTAEANRTAFEGDYGTPLAEVGHRFPLEYVGMAAGIAVVGEGVATQLGRTYRGAEGTSYGFTSVTHDFYPEGAEVTSRVLLFGAATRELAQRYHGDFVDGVNHALTALGLPVRLAPLPK